MPIASGSLGIFAKEFHRYPSNLLGHLSGRTIFPAIRDHWMVTVKVAAWVTEPPLAVTVRG
jgi:hypothetical protein